MSRRIDLQLKKEAIIKADYKKLIDAKKYRSDYIIATLSDKHLLAESSISNIVYGYNDKRREEKQNNNKKAS